MLTIKQAQAKMAAYPALALASENCTLLGANGRILAESVIAPMDVPPCDNSAMDGYAVCLADIAKHHYSLPLGIRVTAGSAPQQLTPGTCARIFTGGPIPQGADTVIIQENTRLDGNTIIFEQAPTWCYTLGSNIRPQGQDVAVGACIAQQGEVITPALLGLLASQGLPSIAVKRKLNIVLLSTGDEIVEPGTPLQAGQIYNSNRYAISGLLAAFGNAEVRAATLPDTLDSTIEAFRQHAQWADAIISFGGVSVGEEDHVKNAVAAIGQVDHWKVKMKPGKPLMLGAVSQEGRETPVIGLPGNPVSAFVTFLLFAKPLLHALMGSKSEMPQRVSLPLGFSLDKPQKRPEYRRVILEGGCLINAGNQSSGVMSSLHRCFGLALIPEDTTLQAGDFVECWPMASLIFE